MKNITIIISLIIVAIGAYVLFGRPTEVNAPNGNTPVDIKTTLEPHHIILKTSRGDIELDLYPAVAPKTVENFMKLAKEKFYDGTKFHRVISDFMVQ